MSAVSPDESVPTALHENVQPEKKRSVKIVNTFKGAVLSEKTISEEEYNEIPKPEPICHMIENPENPAQFLWLNPKQYVEGFSYSQYIKLGLGRVTS